MKTFKALLIACVMCSCLSGAPILIIPEPEILPEPTPVLPPSTEYVSALEKIKTAETQVVKIDSYCAKDLEKLDEFEKAIFLLVQARRFSDELQDLHAHWIDYRDATRSAKSLAKGVPNSKELDDFITKLVILRKEYAKIHLTLVKGTMDKFQDRIPLSDSLYYSSKLEEYYRKEKLIDE
jgi:hypothetical protein